MKHQLSIAIIIILVILAAIVGIFYITKEIPTATSTTTTQVTTTTTSDIKELHLTSEEESELAKYNITVVEELSSTSEQIPLNISYTSSWGLRYSLCSVESQYLGKRHDYNISEYAGKTVLIKTFDTGKRYSDIFHTYEEHVAVILYNEKVICAYKICTGATPSLLAIEKNCGR